MELDEARHAEPAVMISVHQSDESESLLATEAASSRPKRVRFVGAQFASRVRPAR